MLRPLINSVAGQVRAALLAGRDALFGDVVADSFSGDLTGNADTADLADSPEVAFPSYRRIVDAGLGYTALDALYRMQEASGNAKSRGNAADPQLTVNGTPTFGYMIGGYQGTYFDADGDGFAADVLDFGAASAHVAYAFGAVTVGAQRSLVGRWESGAGIGVIALLQANNKIDIPVSDGTLSGGSGVYVGDTAVVVGGIYLLQFHIRRDLATVKGRLSKLGTGLLGAESSTSIAGFATFGGGAGAKSFRLGTGPAWGTGVAPLGCMVRLGAETEGLNKMSAFAARAGFE